MSGQLVRTVTHYPKLTIYLHIGVLNDNLVSNGPCQYFVLRSRANLVSNGPCQYFVLRSRANPSFRRHRKHCKALRVAANLFAVWHYIFKPKGFAYQFSS